jgi:hypothetical protein
MLKLHAGVSRRVGLPGFSSDSASCHIEAELDSSLLQEHEGFQIVVQRAYQSCEQAVEDQIAQMTENDAQHEPQPNQQEVIEIPTSPTIYGARITNGTTAHVPARFSNQPSPRPATASPAKAIRAICARRPIDLVNLLRDRYALTTADELGIRQASTLIDELKSDEQAPTHTNGHSEKGSGPYAVNGGVR